MGVRQMRIVCGGLLLPVVTGVRPRVWVGQHGEAPEPPTGPVRASREAWEAWMASWVAAFWAHEDLPGLRQVIRIMAKSSVAQSVSLDRPHPTRMSGTTTRTAQMGSGSIPGTDARARVHRTTCVAAHVNGWMASRSLS
jgi:hypothetical protein